MRFLNHPRFLLMSLLTPLLLLSPSIFAGILADDWFQRAQLDPAGRVLPAMRGPVLDLFAFFPNDSALQAQLRADGVMPWWTQTDISGAFFRPLAALTHCFDWWILGTDPRLHHIHSLLWFAAALVAGGHFLKRWLGDGPTFRLAFLLYALDESHVMPAVWVANRNALLAMTFGALAGAAHLSAIRAPKNSLVPALWTGLWVAMCLGSAEAGVAVLPLLACLEIGEGSVGRLRRWVPILVPTLTWLCIWKGMGFGMHGTGVYLDPTRDPLPYLSHLPENLGALAAATWLNLPVDGWVLLPRWFSLPFGTLLLTMVFGLLWYLRRPEKSSLQGILISMACLLPATAVFPMNRVVGLAGLGVAGALAPILLSASKLRWPLGILHLTVSALILVLSGYFLPKMMATTVATVDTVGDDEALTGQHIIFLSGHEMSTIDIPLIRQLEHRPSPASMLLVGPAMSPLVLSRPDAKTLWVECPEGAFRYRFERLFRADPFVVGERYSTKAAEVVVEKVDGDGNLLAWSVHFMVPLEDPSLIWRRAEGLTFVEARPPAMGERMEVGAVVGY